MAKQWSPKSVADLGVRTDMETSNEILGMSRAYGYQLAKEGKYPVPVLKLGRKYVVPVAGLLKVLGIEDDTKATA
ncbi:DNA-binding protein [Rhodococcus sp. SJ-2]